MKTVLQWLIERKQFLTASDVAAVLGIEGAFGNILDVWLDKTTPEFEEYDNPILRYGRHMEPFTADLYAETTGREVRDPGGTEILVHPSIPWLGATLDREVLIDGKWHPLEIKQVNDPSWIFRREEWESTPPGKYWVQSQIQGQCQQSELCCLTGQFPLCELAVADFPRDDEFFDMAFDTLDAFWNHNVKKKIPPTVPDNPKALQSVKRIYRRQDGETVMLNASAKALADKWSDHKWDAKESTRKTKIAEAKLRGMIGGATYGAFPDGSYLERDRNDILRRKR